MFAKLSNPSLLCVPIMAGICWVCWRYVGYYILVADTKKQYRAAVSVSLLFKGTDLIEGPLTKRRPRKAEEV